MSSPPTVPAQLVAGRAPIIKIAEQQTYTYGYNAHPASAASAARTGSAPVRSFSFSSQGGRCHCCGGIFVISNRCSNRECDHVQCSQCY